MLFVTYVLYDAMAFCWMSWIFWMLKIKAQLAGNGRTVGQTGMDQREIKK
jgi:hypothetical protein